MCVSSASTGLCGGQWATAVPTATHAGIPTGIPRRTPARTPAWQPERSLHELSATISPEWIRRISRAALHYHRRTTPGRGPTRSEHQPERDLAAARARAVGVAVGGDGQAHARRRLHHAGRRGIRQGVDRGGELVVEHIECLEHQHSLHPLREGQRARQAPVHGVLVRSGAQAAHPLERHPVPASRSVERVGVGHGDAGELLAAHHHHRRPVLRSSQCGDPRDFPSVQQETREGGIALEHRGLPQKVHGPPLPLVRLRVASVARVVAGGDVRRNPRNHRRSAHIVDGVRPGVGRLHAERARHLLAQLNRYGVIPGTSAVLDLENLRLGPIVPGGIDVSGERAGRLVVGILDRVCFSLGWSGQIEVGRGP